MFYSDTSSAPKVYLGGSVSHEVFSYRSGDSGVPIAYHRKVTSTEWEWRGLTLAAADSIATTKAALTTGDNNRYATSYRRTSEAGTYSVQVSHTVTDTWTTW